ncbi:MAG: hypothetical protein HQK96_19270 [Nitrospirae bacterium]|nr:hypothetical protein [Nitrospirota bacterium]
MFKNTQLYERLLDNDIHAELLTGETKTADRKRIVNDLNAGKIRLLVATTQLVGEGFDVKELSSLFLTTPIKWQGKTTQAIGRVLRTATGKDRPVIYDYVDAHQVLKASFRSRVGVYRSLNCELPFENN